MAVIAICVVIALQAVRSAAVAAWYELEPTAAARLWGGHPAVEVSRGLALIALASRNRTAPPADAFAMINDAARKDPLAAEPYLVRGVQLSLQGDDEQARSAFQAAEWRDPRSLSARYFLANAYLRAGDVRGGIEEFAALARLSPAAGRNVAPLVAQYAQYRSNWPQLRLLFRADPALEDPALAAMAADASNADAVLALADESHRGPTAPWLRPLVRALIADRQYMRAKAIWAQVSGAPVASGQLLYDSMFADDKSPPPFNWTLTSSSTGVAEREPGGRLHVIFYGENDGVLAAEMLTLSPGTYALSMRVSADRPSLGALTWSVSCVDASKPVASAPLGALSGRSWQFEIPENCGAQLLQLGGDASDVGRQSEAIISDMRLRRAGS